MARKRSSVAVVVMLIGLILSVPAFVGAMPGEGPSPEGSLHRPFGRLMRLLRDFDLTDDQKASIEVIANETRESIEPIVEQLKGLGLDEAMFAEEIDTYDVEQKIDSMVDLRSRIISIKAEAVLEVSQVLTPEQRSIVLERIDEHREKRGKIKEIMQGSGN